MPAVLGDHPPDRADPASDPRQRHQRIHPVDDGTDRRRAAGAIYAWASASLSSPVGALIPIFFIDVVTAAIGIGFIALIPVTAVRRAGDVAPGYFADLVDGVRYVAHHAFVRWLLLLFAIVFLLTVAPSNLTPLMAVRSFDAGEQQNVINLAVLEIIVQRRDDAGRHRSSPRCSPSAAASG